MRLGDDVMMGRFKSSWRTIGALVCAVALLFGALACEKSPRQKLLRAKANLASGENPDKSEKLLNSVLEAQPENLEAKRLIAEVYRLRGEFKRAEEQLDKLWKDQGFGKENAKLSARMKNTRELVRTQFVDLYKAWAKDIGAEENPEKFAETAKKGLEYNERDMDLNSLLVDYYWKKGQRLVEKGKKKEAAEAFEEILQLRTRRGDERRQKAKKKARDLRLEFFMAEGRKRFKENGKQTISEIDGLELNEKGDTILIDMEQDVDRRLNPNKESHKKKAQQIAFIGLIDKLRKVSLSIAGLPKETDLRMIGTEKAKRILLSKLKFDETNFRRGRYAIKAKLPVEEAIGMAYDVQTAVEKAQEAAKDAKKKEEAKKGDKEGAGDKEKGEGAAEKGGDSADKKEKGGSEKGGNEEKKKK